MKTSELTGAQLDWVVAKALGKLPATYDDWAQTWPHFSTDWSQGGPIIEREFMDVVVAPEGGWYAWKDNHGPDSVVDASEGRGPTPLVAAMRCYVSSKLGDEVEIPKEIS